MTSCFGGSTPILGRKRITLLQPERLAIETVDYLCVKLVQLSEMTGNAKGVSKHVAMQYIKIIMVIYILQQNFRQNLHFDVIYYCLHLNSNFHCDKLYCHVFGGA